MSEFVNPQPAIEAHLLPDALSIPNNPRLPVLIYRLAVITAAGEEPEDVFERLFQQQRWLNPWRNGIYSFHHYHSTSHEVLGVFAGEATICLGGETGIRVMIETGDVVVIPAGVGHRNLRSSTDFGVVGAYPDGRRWDLCRGKPGERPTVDRNIAEVPLPACDPLPGLQVSALARYWR